MSFPDDFPSFQTWYIFPPNLLIASICKYLGVFCLKAQFNTSARLTLYIHLSVCVYPPVLLQDPFRAVDLFYSDELTSGYQTCLTFVARTVARSSAS